MLSQNGNLRIAVVDDEVDLLDMYDFELQDYGFASKGFSQSETACKAIIDGDFDLVISDIRMPCLTGLQLLEKVTKEMPSAPPFVFVTGFSQYGREELMKAGAKEVFQKPIDVEVIAKWIDSFFEKAS